MNVISDAQILKTRSVRGVTATLFVQALKFLLRFGSIVVLARLLTPEDFGLVAMVAPIVALAQTLNEFGLTQAVVQRQDISTSQVSSLFWLTLVISIGLAGLLLALAPIISELYNEPATADILRVMAGLVVVGAAGMVPTALLSRSMLFIPLAGIDLACTIINVIVSLAAAWLGLGYWSLVYGQVAASLLNVILVFTMARWLPDYPDRAAGMGPLVRFGINLTGVNLANYFMLTADNMIVGAVVGKTGLGIYDRSYALIAQPLGQVMGPIGRVAVPLLSRLIINTPLYRTTFIALLNVCLLMTVPAVIFSIAFAEPALIYILGENWRRAIRVFAWLCLGGLAVPFFVASTWLFVSQGRTGALLTYTVVTSVISIASFALGVAWGVEGVARMSAISFAFIQTPIMLFGATRLGAVGLLDVGGVAASYFVAASVTIAILLIFPQHPRLLVMVGTLGFSYGLFALVIYLLPGGRALFQTLWGMTSAFRRSDSNTTTN